MRGGGTHGMCIHQQSSAHDLNHHHAHHHQHHHQHHHHPHHSPSHTVPHLQGHAQCAAWDERDDRGGGNQSSGLETSKQAWNTLASWIGSTKVIAWHSRPKHSLATVGRVIVCVDAGATATVLPIWHSRRRAWRRSGECEKGMFLRSGEAGRRHAWHVHTPAILSP